MIGAALFGAMAGLYAAAPVVFAADVRTTGLGWAIGIGRVGAILSPLSVGLLVDRGLVADRTVRAVRAAAGAGGVGLPAACGSALARPAH